MSYELASDSWGKEEYAAIQRVLDSGRFTMGENVKQFERAFADKFSMPYGVMVSSGSTANLVAVASLFYRKDNPLRPGDEVIVPAISWATTYYPLHQYGLKLKFVDVELDSINMDVSQLEAALTPRTRMVVGVSILGNPAKLDVMRSFCDKHDLILFEDNCESMGASLNGKPTGTYGDINTFSLFFSHHISTMEGGVILTEDEELYHLCLSLRAHGWVRDVPRPGLIYEKRPDAFDEAYRFILPGYNARPLEISGAVGVEQLKRLDDAIAIRRRNAEHFTGLFAGDKRFILQRENGSSSWFSFTMILHPDHPRSRDDVFQVLRPADIGFRMVTGGNMLRHDVIKYFAYEVTGGSAVNADTVHDRGFFVGNHPTDIRAQIDHLHKTLGQLD